MTTTASPLSQELIGRIVEAIRAVRFGTVHITIHDSRVVQIEKSEKIRVTHMTDPTPGGLPYEPSRADRTSGSPRSNPAR